MCIMAKTTGALRSCPLRWPVLSGYGAASYKVTRHANDVGSDDASISRPLVGTSAK